MQPKDGPSLSLPSISNAVTARLADKIYKKRRSAALDVQHLVKELAPSHKEAGVKEIIRVLKSEFVYKTNPNARKGGLMALSAVTIALADHVDGILPRHLDRIVPTVLSSFSDPDSSVRYSACEALYNIAKVARQMMLPYIDQIFDILARLVADTNDEAQNGAGLLDRLFKDILSEQDDEIELQPFVDLVAERMYVLDPHSREFLVSWIHALYTVPGVSFRSSLPQFLDGLLRIAQDPHRSIQRICDELLEGFLAEIQQAGRCDGTRVLPVLLKHASDTDHTRSRTLALTWLAAVLPLDPRSALVHAPAVIDVALPTLSTSHVDAVREVAVSINQRLRSIVAEAAPTGDHAPAADAEALDFGATVMALAQQLTVKSVTTRLAALRWILMLHRALPDKLYDHTQQITPVLLQSVFEPSDRVSRLALECVAEISSWPLPAPTAEQEALAHRAFADFVVAMLTMDDGQRRLVSRGAFVLCALGGFLGPATVCRALAEGLLVLQDRGSCGAAMHHLCHVIMCADEFEPIRDGFRHMNTAADVALFGTMYKAWCPAAVATVALCFLAEQYEHACHLLLRIADLEVTLQTGAEVALLVSTLESPTFARLRMQLLDTRRNAHLVKALYGLLLLLPQGSAYSCLRSRIATVAEVAAALDHPCGDDPTACADKMPIDSKELLAYFDNVHSYASVGR
eukprot:m.1264809 g.1264809  ORF g.1264809 m.1264809 type:complete len:687 (+) comp24736_c0_seq16:173-2233(+)